MRTQLFLTLAISACTSASPRDEEVADQPPAPELRTPFDAAPLAARADRVVHGHVTQLTYDTVPSGPLAGIARTHVMVAVDHALKGGADSLDLAFLGGAYPDGRVSIASEIPLFGAGDEVVLFVAGDRSTGCPLVDCAAGLIRMSSGKAYDAEGHPLIARGTKLELGAREAIPEATTFKVGRQVFGFDSSDREPSSDAAIDRGTLLARFTTLSTSIAE